MRSVLQHAKALPPKRELTQSDHREPVTPGEIVDVSRALRMIGQPTTGAFWSRKMCSTVLLHRSTVVGTIGVLQITKGNTAQCENPRYPRPRWPGTGSSLAFVLMEVAL